ncbi:CheR family methyltransferase [Oscillatoria acuminata]|uniref:protein-glutamate O-methyltransferase n=1 Tax=Oscillatoria acuminata PCC 6304 TaxID=56110 RepID=K9TMT8_9CYAN|nr:protein-glutamate O-methyltransferase CheR [Oscillatoria acuminata]AFY83723.1 methylase of chemotaxis methyl-accepting protein [Oscillatoria acuminata PCC 6304]
MRFFPQPLQLTDSVFTILRDLIHERSGLHYENDKRDILADKLTPRVIERGLNSFLDYYYLLKYDESAQDEWKSLIDVLSVQETFFWRESDALTALVEVVLPQYLAERRGAFNPGGSYSFSSKPLRIWSSACATGEEPLSIGMALEEGGWFERLPIELYASDAAAGAIAKARKGVYRERSFRNFPASLQEKYFTKSEFGWQVSSNLHKRIQWNVANLMNGSEIERFSQSDIIFCRNVFIYFSPNSIRKTVDYFYQKMPDRAYLFLGSSESLLKLNSDFELQEIGGAFVYVKNKSI